MKIEGSRGGAWTEETHLKLHPNLFCKGMVEYIKNDIKPKSILEFGSGLGYHAKYLNDMCNLNNIVHCIEPNKINGQYNNSIGPKLFSINIFENKLPKEMLPKYDLVFTTEVAEHITRELHGELFDFLVNRTNKWIVFSAAIVGQGGTGHIAERPEEEWKDELTSRGMCFMDKMTKDIRKECNDVWWLKQNLMVFKK